MEPVWLERARELRASGASVTTISQALGVPRSTVHDWLLGLEHRRAVAAERAPRCPKCGEPTAGRPVEACGRCRAREADATARRFVALWHGGLPAREIAAELGWTKGAAMAQLHRYRRQGYDLPYRRSEDEVRNINDGVRRYWEAAAAT